MRYRLAEKTRKAPRRTAVRNAAAALCLAGLLFLFTASCTVRQQVELGREGSGTAEIEVELHQMAVQYINDLIVFSGGPEPDSIFDPEAIRAAFDTIPDLTLRHLEITGSGSLRIGLTFSDVRAVFTSQVGEGVVPVARASRKGKTSEAGLYLDRDNYGAIVARVLVLSGMIAFEDYLTGLLEPGPEEVILDMYEYAFEEYTEGKSVRDVLEESEIVLEFAVPNRIISHRGGEIPETGGDARIRYTVPLLDILTLDEPISYSFDYR